MEFGPNSGEYAPLHLPYLHWNRLLLSWHDLDRDIIAGKQTLSWIDSVWYQMVKLDDVLQCDIGPILKSIPYISIVCLCA